MGSGPKANYRYFCLSLCMKKALFLLLFYFCLTITVGKQVRAICSQLLAGKDFGTKTLALDFSNSEAENEEADSDDTEENDDNDDHELIGRQILCVADSPSTSSYSTPPFFEDHLKEIGTPPPRF
jgi:hypothetical protein